MKKIIIFLFTSLCFSCNDQNSQVITTKDGIYFSGKKMNVQDKPMFGTQWSTEMLSLSREKQMQIVDEFEMKLFKAGIQNLEVVDQKWQITKEKIEKFLVSEKKSLYINELTQFAAQYMLLQTDLLKDNSQDAQIEILRNLQNMAKYGSSSIAVIKYVYDNYSSELSKPIKKQVAIDVLKNYRKYVGGTKLTKEEKTELAKHNPTLLTKMEFMENANLLAQEEFSKY